jgi:spore germination protein KB
MYQQGKPIVIRRKSMDNEGHIGLYEAVCITVLIVFDKGFYSSVAIIVNTVGTAAWYMTLISCAVSLMFYYFEYLLIKRFPGLNIIQVYEAVMGKFIGKIIGISICAYTVYYSGSTLREFVDMIKTYNLPNTPPFFIMACILAVAILVSYYGLEVISRICTLFFIPIISGIVLLLILAAPSYNLNSLRPYLGYGLKKTFYLGFLRSSAYSEVGIILIFANALQDTKSLKKAGLISILLSGILFSACLVGYTLTFGYAAGGGYISGLFELSKTIYFNRFFQRIESLFLFTWSISSIINAAISFYICISVYCKVFNIKKHRPLLLPFSFIIFVTAILPGTSSDVLQVNMLILRQYSLFLTYFVPLLVLIVSILLSKKGENTNEQKS